jgi:hypothetical protein
MPQAGGNVLKRLLNSIPVLTLMLFSGVGALQAQNSLTVGPVTVFLNGTVGGAPFSSPLRSQAVPSPRCLSPNFQQRIVAYARTHKRNNTGNLDGYGKPSRSDRRDIFHEHHPEQFKRNPVAQLVVFTVNNPVRP